MGVMVVMVVEQVIMDGPVVAAEVEQLVIYQILLEHQMYMLLPMVVAAVAAVLGIEKV
jgi:hypothetical protein